MPLLLLEKGDASKPAIILIHDVTGHSSLLVEKTLSLIENIFSENETPYIYALESSLEKLKTKEISNISQLTEDHIASMRREKLFDAHESFIFVGWSFGAFVGFEMMKILEAPNEFGGYGIKINGLYLLDPPSTTFSEMTSQEIEQHKKFIFDRMANTIISQNNLSEHLKFNYVAENSSFTIDFAINFSVDMDMMFDVVARFKVLWANTKNHLGMLENYLVTPWKQVSKIVQFNAGKLSLPMPDNIKWNTLGCDYSLMICDSDDHFTILNNPIWLQSLAEVVVSNQLERESVVPSRSYGK